MSFSTTADEQITTIHLEGLNPEQQTAVETVDGPLLVLAGAGTGKTRVLTSRIAHILLQGAAFPSQILAVTFTNKAAHEMRQRVQKVVGDLSEGIWLGTFHSIALRILRRHSELLGFTSHFLIIDTDDQVRLIKQVISELGIDEKKWGAKAALAIIQKWKDQGLKPTTLKASDVPAFAQGKMQDVYAAYQRRLQQLQAMDFGDLLLQCITLFQEHPDVLAEYQQRFRYILVDEYQDTNITQYLWLRMLAQKQKNICCVGDDDQSIYGWRGAEVGNILRFEKDYPDATVIRLEQNYRSTPSILGAASSLIAHNTGRLGKTLWTDIEDKDKVRVTGYYNDRDEARLIGQEADAIQQVKGASLHDIAILVRTSSQTRLFEEHLVMLGIPYQVLGGLKFYERMEIRDVIAYMRVLVQPVDDLAFERIVNLPKRGIGKSKLQLMFKYSSETGVSLYQSAKDLVAENQIAGQAKQALVTLFEQFDRWNKLRETEHFVKVIETMLNESGYLPMWKEQKTTDAEARLENIYELLHALQEFDTITAFLEHVSLVTDVDKMDDSDLLTIMTIHAAKGLEFNTVFLPGWEEGLFPHQRALDENGKDGLEEERRLAYVAITRAKERCYISFANSRKLFNQFQNNLPSRFIDELPEEHVESQQVRIKQQSWERQDDDWNQDFSDESFNNLNFSAKRSAQSDAAWRQGQRVFHQKFGYGNIRSVDGNHLDIAFEKAGRKKVIADFVEKV